MIAGKYGRMIRTDKVIRAVQMIGTTGSQPQERIEYKQLFDVEEPGTSTFANGSEYKVPCYCIGHDHLTMAGEPCKQSHAAHVYTSDYPDNICLIYVCSTINLSKRPPEFDIPAEAWLYVCDAKIDESKLMLSASEDRYMVKFQRKLDLLESKLDRVLSLLLIHKQ